MYRVFFNHFELADMFNNLPQKFNHSTITLCIIVLSFRYILLYIVIVSYSRFGYVDLFIFIISTVARRFLNPMYVPEYYSILLISIPKSI